MPVDDNGVERVIQYVLYQLNDSERKWATIEKEAIRRCLLPEQITTLFWGEQN